MPKKDKIIYARVCPEEFDKIKAQAERNDRTISSYVLHAVREHIRKDIPKKA